MFLKDSKYVQICKENDYVEVLNSHSRFFKGFIQLEMDRWGVIRPCNDEELQKQTEPVKDYDLSAIEYELSPPDDDREKKQKNKREENKQEESKALEGNGGSRRARGGANKGNRQGTRAPITPKGDQ